MGRDAGVTTQGPTQLSEKPIWPELPDQVPMEDADASTHPRAFFVFYFLASTPASRLLGPWEETTVEASGNESKVLPSPVCKHAVAWRGKFPASFTPSEAPVKPWLTLATRLTLPALNPWLSGVRREPCWPPSHFWCFGEEATAAIGVIEWTLMVLVLGSSVPATLTS